MQFPSLQCGMMYSKSEIVSKYDGGDELAALQQVDILTRSAWGPGQHIDIIAVLQFAIVAVCELFCCGGRSDGVMDGVPRRIHRDIVSELNQFRARADSGDTDITDNQGFTILTLHVHLVHNFRGRPLI